MEILKKTVDSALIALFGVLIIAWVIWDAADLNISIPSRTGNSSQVFYSESPVDFIFGLSMQLTLGLLAVWLGLKLVRIDMKGSRAEDAETIDAELERIEAELKKLEDAERQLVLNESVCDTKNRKETSQNST